MRRRDLEERGHTVGEKGKKKGRVEKLLRGERERREGAEEGEKSDRKRKRGSCENVRQAEQ